MVSRIRLLVLIGMAGLFIPLAAHAQPAVELDAQTGTVPSSGVREKPSAPNQTEPAKNAESQPGAARTGSTATNVQQNTAETDGTLSLQSQEPSQVTSLAELDAESRKLGNWIRQGLGSLPNGARIRLGQFSLNGTDTDLGIYWRNQLSSILSSMQDRNFVIVTDPTAQADYTLAGEIMRIGNILRLYTRLTRLEDSALITTWTLDLTLTPFIQELIGSSQSGGSDSSASRVYADSYEPDSRDNPIKADIDAPEISRTLHDGDEDWFAVETPDNGTLILETTGSMDTFMELYDGASGSSSRLTSNDDGGNNLNARIEYFAEAGKTYLAKVRGLGGDTGSYGFKATFNPMPTDPSEPNDAQEQATVIELDTPVEASFQSPSDEDWYYLAVPEDGGYLIVYTEGRMDTRITVYDEAGSMLADDDDSGRGLNARASVQVSGGTVYIRVKEVDGDRGSYTLYSQVRTPGASDAFEPDNTAETAKEIQLGTSQQRTLTTADDTDWVKFTITEAGSYAIRTIAADGHLDTYIELYDENQEYLDDDDDGGANYDAYLRTELQPGTYFILISTLDDDPLDNNAYTLSVSAEAGDEEEGM
ncbi:MAG: PPC domain-containing protein [Spirochaetaceae bacterium]|jgi:hypothetical protein|nr:PPC domain-containing protein [Spirochaetaceae bacterium]